MDRIMRYLKQNKIFVALAALTVAGFLLYANTFVNRMFWDDNDFILNNAFVHDWNSISKYFSENVIAGAGFVSNYWRPVLLGVFSIEYHLWGAHPFGYHLVNLLIHLADSILVFFLFNNLFRRYKLALFTALIFLIHPLQTEAVTYVNSLGDSLSVFFMLIGLNNYLDFSQNNDRTSFWWSVACYPLALMSKETAIIYPGLLAMIEFYHLPDLNFKTRMRNILRFIWPTVSIAALYLLLRATVLNFQNTFNLYNQDNLFTSHVSVRIFSFFQTLATYFGLLFYPHNLHMERSLPLTASFTSLPVLVGCGLFVMLLALIVFCWKKQSVVSFGLLWFLAGLAPTSNILVPINGLLYEHWLYLPMIGLWLAVVGFLLSKRSAWLPFLIVISAWLVFLSVTTIVRNRQWHDPIRFYNQTLTYAPTSYRVLNNLGMAYDDNNQHAEAISTYQRAIQIDPTVAVAYHNLGNAYKALGQIDLAVQSFENAIQKDPSFYYSYNALADLYLKQNRVDLALAELKKLQQQYPNYSYAGQLVKQIEDFERSKQN